MLWHTTADDWWPTRPPALQLAENQASTSRAPFSPLACTAASSGKSDHHSHADSPCVALFADMVRQVAAGDNLIVLAHTSIIETLKQPAGDDSEMLKHSRNAIHRVAHMGTEQVSSRRLLVVGWPLESISEVLAGLSSFAPPGSEATFLVAKAPDAVCAPQKSRSKSGDRSNLATEFIETEITMGAENFRAINLATCDSVIIGVPSELGYPDSDALVLSALLQIQKLAAECERMVHVVFKASSPNTKEVALQFLHSLTKCYVSVEVVLTSQLTSAILTQVLWQPSVIDLVVELMVYAEGNELYLLEPDQLGLQVRLKACQLVLPRPVQDFKSSSI
mmetsp:Transcript_5648/g.17167  ORF Transcript_5648/g.17167 Transcript_5648/m.17167 type:complete len:335 (+) Transcript_5648:2346-3350(+)